MNYTQHYQLPQWVETDRILRTDFNDMTDKLDTALGQHSQTLDTLQTDVSAAVSAVAEKGNCQIYRATYSGTGTLSCTFDLPGQPALVMALGDGVCLFGVRNGSYGFIINGSGGGCDLLSSFSCGSASVSWSASGNARFACNASGRAYVLLALLAL